MRPRTTAAAPVTANRNGNERRRAHEFHPALATLTVRDNRMTGFRTRSVNRRPSPSDEITPA
jgi:hypothetical protein